MTWRIFVDALCRPARAERSLWGSGGRSRSHAEQPRVNRDDDLTVTRGLAEISNALGGVG